MSWAIGLSSSLVAISILALVFFGISHTKLYSSSPAFNGMSCQGEISFPSFEKKHSVFSSFDRSFSVQSDIGHRKATLPKEGFPGHR
mmetsp:Transcript_16869/g.23846  ORF Transcript_16869/g.23846 Transcript_16869/m.23846 type:complete len:87 (+) Transcript_16869:538-798(+)